MQKKINQTHMLTVFKVLKTKSILDFMISTLGMVLLSPLFIIIAILIKITSRGTILFKQQRVGQYSKLFYIHKFRTMVMNAEQQGLSITANNDARITKIGKILRKTKLDELPQLYDVLIGNMSIVGPRPEVLEYVNLYPEHIKQIILSVKPGITDLASIEMINEAELLEKSTNPKEYYTKHIIPQKLALMVEYVNTQSTIGDIQIILKTLYKITNYMA